MGNFLYWCFLWRAVTPESIFGQNPILVDCTDIFDTGDFALYLVLIYCLFCYILLSSHNRHLSCFSWCHLRSMAYFFGFSPKMLFSNCTASETFHHQGSTAYAFELMPKRTSSKFYDQPPQKTYCVVLSSCDMLKSVISFKHLLWSIHFTSWPP